MPDFPDAVLAVPEIRDFEQINKELARLLAEGARRIVLDGVERQRLLAAGLRGPWSATIEVVGHAGPELAASLNAPGVTVVCRGDAADGAGSGLVSGLLVIAGDSGAGVGYHQKGGAILVRGAAGDRAGLRQAGGALVLLGPVGALAGESQSGGVLIRAGSAIGPHPGRGRRGGRFVSIGAGEGGADDPSGRRAVEEASAACRAWLTPADLGRVS